jgi:hypothetical protein
MWVRVGWIEPPIGLGEWCTSHLSLPFCIPKNATEYRVYFSSRDSDQRSHVGWVDLDINSDHALKTNFGKKPLVCPGKAGTFDEHGVSGSYFEVINKRLRIWNFGWQRLQGKAWSNAIGLVENSIDDTESTSNNTLIIKSNEFETNGLAYPYLVSLNSTQHMFYGTFDLLGIPSLNEPYSFIAKRAKIGHDFKLSDRSPMITHTIGKSAQSRPCIIRDGGGFRAWISVKGEGYEICSAYSQDLRSWHWSDEGYDLRPNGLNEESREVCYSHVVDFKDSRLMFYNGDGFGKSGIGIAKWQE